MFDTQCVDMCSLTRRRDSELQPFPPEAVLQQSILRLYWKIVLDRTKSVLGSVVKKRLPAPTALVNLAFDLGFEFEASS
jgi:hypothetical protein